MKKINFILTFCIMVSFTTMKANSRIYVKVKPTHNVAVVRKSCPGKGYVWTSGNWVWNSKHNQYVWVDGEWVIPTNAKLWIDGHWKLTPHGYTWVPGHWK